VAIAERKGFAGYFGMKSLPELIASFDAASALVHVPSEEAFGLVVAEALARNLKFFGTNVGGLRDIADGVEGAELVSPMNFAGLSAAITSWLALGCPRPTSSVQQIRLRYHPAVIARRHLEIYREILGTAKNGKAKDGLSRD
jgi:glycosyltransferase involved in cell wall biosynthesis